MRLSEQDFAAKKEEFQNAGYELPVYDRRQLIEKTAKEPTWIHFGTGNIFRAFPAAVLEDLLNQGKYDRGVIAVEGFDYEIIERAYQPYENLSLLVVLKADGTIEKKVIGSVTESIAANEADAVSWNRLIDIFETDSLQMASFTITEKGYSLNGVDLGVFPPQNIMGKVTLLLLKRFEAGAAPIAMVSMDNCSHNGDKLCAAIQTYGKAWAEAGIAPPEFLAYLSDKNKVSYPLSMIDKITPRPDDKVVAMLQKDGFEDTNLIITGKHTYTSPFVNAEETQYLVIEDVFPNGRPPFEEGGILFTNRETVDKVEKMKVCTCLNPLHTALAVFGCLLGYKSIWEEMQDEDLCRLVTNLGYQEGMPVVVDPGIIQPKQFIDEVLTKRLPNPFMPDAPQRIATDTSQKIPIRFGETLKAYCREGKQLTGLSYIPLVLAGYLRYLTGVDDEGNAMELSADPMLAELTKIMEPYAGRATKATAEDLRPILERTDIFAVDLYETGLAEIITERFNELNAGIHAVRRTLSQKM